MANIFASTRRTPDLSTQLTLKSEELRVRQEREAQASENFIAAAAQARSKSETAAIHADAVERAVRILDDAGVQF